MSISAPPLVSVPMSRTQHTARYTSTPYAHTGRKLFNKATQNYGERSALMERRMPFKNGVVLTHSVAFNDAGNDISSTPNASANYSTHVVGNKELYSKAVSARTKSPRKMDPGMGHFWAHRQNLTKLYLQQGYSSSDKSAFEMASADEGRRKSFLSSQRYTPVELLSLLKSYMDSKHMRVIDLFREFDEDGSTEIEPGEMMSVFSKHLGIELSATEVVLLMKELDEDYDGQISASEFEVAIKAFKRTAPVNVPSSFKAIRIREPPSYPHRMFNKKNHKLQHKKLQNPKLKQTREHVLYQLDWPPKNQLVPVRPQSADDSAVGSEFLGPVVLAARVLVAARGGPGAFPIIEKRKPHAVKNVKKRPKRVRQKPTLGQLRAKVKKQIKAKNSDALPKISNQHIAILC